jgi:hypothetical protein
MSDALAVLRAADLEEQAAERCWLIEGLWAEGGVGIVGGEPKCCKSYLALDCAVAVASGRPALGRFSVKEPGRVLLFAAEDALGVVKKRLAGIAEAADVSFSELEVFVITVPQLRLDLEADRQRLQATVEQLQPRLLVLDPFVRLHRIDENLAHDVSPILGYLRGLQRAYGCAVMLVHHAKKGASGARGGQALRGSSELHAWGDSNLYLKRKGQELQLSVEHRAAPGIDGLSLELGANGGPGLALRLVDRVADAATSDSSDGSTILDRVEQALTAAHAPQTVRSLRSLLRIRTATLCDALVALVEEGRAFKGPEGYLATAP